MDYINEFDTPESTQYDCEVRQSYVWLPVGCPQTDIIAVCDQTPWKMYWYDSNYTEDLGLTEFACSQIGGTWTAY